MTSTSVPPSAGCSGKANARSRRKIPARAASSTRRCCLASNPDPEPITSRYDVLARILIRAGLRGAFGVMRELGMLRSTRTRSESRQPEPVVTRSSQWVRAPQGGILRAVKPLGARVSKGDLLGLIADSLGASNAAYVARGISGFAVQGGAGDYEKPAQRLPACEQVGLHLLIHYCESTRRRRFQSPSPFGRYRFQVKTTYRCRSRSSMVSILARRASSRSRRPISLRYFSCMPWPFPPL